MQFTGLKDGEELPPIRMVRVRVKNDHTDDWSEEGKNSN
jgi:hypothetical protein